MGDKNDSKSIEVHYDASAMSEMGPGEPDLFKTLAFSDAARSVIETALEQEQAGEWAGAQIDETSMAFGFRVKDPEHAETVVREAVTGTPYERIREILRRGGLPEEEEV